MTKGIQEGPQNHDPIEPAKKPKLAAFVCALLLPLAVFAGVQDGPDGVDGLGVIANKNTLSFNDGVGLWLAGAVSARVLPDGAVRFVDCYEPARWGAMIGPEGYALAAGFAKQGGYLNQAVVTTGMRAAFVDLVATGVVRGPDVSEAYRAFIWDRRAQLRGEAVHVAEAVQLAGWKLAEDLTLTPTVALSGTTTCTVGRCDCQVCLATSCGCETVTSFVTYDCAGPRSNCNTETWVVSPKRKVMVPVSSHDLE